jgi:hypothetical protein
LRSRGEPLARFAIGYGEDAGMAKADYRTKAGECYRMAAMAPSLADQVRPEFTLYARPRPEMAREARARPRLMAS